MYCRRDCRGGAHSWADADLVGQSGQLERQQIGTAEIAGWQALMLNVGATAPDFTLRDQNQQLVTLRGYRGAKNVLLVFFPLAFTGICQGELDQLRDHLPEFENDDSAALAISVGRHPLTRSGRRRADSRFRCCRTSGHTARSVRAYGVFNEQAGIANRGTFVVDRSGIIRFAEMKQPGEVRDQRLWTDALAALTA